MDQSNHLPRVFRRILPSFLLPGPDTFTDTGQFRRSSTEYRQNIRGSTDFLEGIRGIASIIVLITHLLCVTHPKLLWGFGGGDNPNYYILQLPFVRLIYGGSAMVSLFFIVSGYALSFKVLKKARSAQWEKLFSQLSSSVLRRTARLLVPSLIVSLITMVLAQLGAFEHGSDIVSSIEWPVSARRAESLFEQIKVWRDATWTQFYPWTWDIAGSDYLYGYQFWTIAVELRCSMILYLFVTATSFIRYRVRQLISLSFQCFCMLSARWDVAIFIHGMFLADVHVEYEEKYGEYGPQGGMSDFSNPPFLTTILFIIGLFLSSNPDVEADKTPGYTFLNQMVPSSYAGSDKFRFWLAVGSAIVVYTISRSNLLQTILCLSVIRYLGKISFSLYLVHGFMISSLGAWVFEMASYFVGSGADWQYEISFLIMFLAVFPPAILVAHLFWQFVDIPIVSLTKKVENLALPTLERPEFMEMVA